jgi:hypothetical protein
MHPVLQAAIDDATAAFGPDNVVHVELPDGTVRVTVRGQDAGEKWQPQFVDITANLLVTFPTTQPYPFYLPADVSRTSGAMPSNMTRVNLDGVAFTQLSVRPQGGRTVDSFAALIGGVASWLRSN